jgi:hypothetical protein
MDYVDGALAEWKNRDENWQPKKTVADIVSRSPKHLGKTLSDTTSSLFFDWCVSQSRNNPKILTMPTQVPGLDAVN